MKRRGPSRCRDTHRVGEAFLLGRAAVAAAHQHPQAMRVGRSLQVVALIADKRRIGGFGAEPLHCVEQHAGGWLARGRPAVVGRAAQDQVDACSVPGKLPAQTLMNRIELPPVDDAARYFRLVGADDDAHTRLAHPGDRLGDTRNELELRRTLDMVLRGTLMTPSRSSSTTLMVQRDERLALVGVPAGTGGSFARSASDRRNHAPRRADQESS